MKAITYLAAVCLVAAGLSACSSPQTGDSTSEAGSEAQQSQSASATIGTDATSAGSTPSASSSSGPTPSPTTTALVSQFPTELLPVMPGSTVLSSSVDKTGDTAVVSVTGTVDKSAKDILNFYRSSLKEAGFKELQDEFSDESVLSQDFIRNESETINVSIVAGTKMQKESVYTVGGTLLPESTD